jgi:hypothetical protein
MSKKAFFISRIGEPDSPERKQSDRLLQYIIIPVLNDRGYDPPMRADQMTTPGVISAQVFKRLWEDDLVIADLSGGNPNVFYELAIRHLRKLPCIQMIRREEKLPFDVATGRTISFGFQVEEVYSSKRELDAMIKAAEEAPASFNTELSVSMDQMQMEATGNPVEKVVTEILSNLQILRGIVENLQRSVEGGMRMKLSPGASPWVQTMYSELAPDDIALILLFYERREKQKRSSFHIDKLRQLRNRGLLLYDQGTLASSNEVWLSDLGKELAKALLESRKEPENRAEFDTKT